MHFRRLVTEQFWRAVVQGGPTHFVSLKESRFDCNFFFVLEGKDSTICSVYKTPGLGALSSEKKDHRWGSPRAGKAFGFTACSLFQQAHPATECSQKGEGEIVSVSGDSPTLWVSGVWQLMEGEGMVGPGPPPRSSYSTDSPLWSITGEWINYFNCGAGTLQMLTNSSNIMQLTPWSFR